jgi:hypothetical protein
MNDSAPVSIHRNAPIDDIASYIIIEPPPLCCGSYDFDPTLPDELRRYGVDDIRFQIVVQAIRRRLSSFVFFVLFGSQNSGFFNGGEISCLHSRIYFPIVGK